LHFQKRHDSTCRGRRRGREKKEEEEEEEEEEKGKEEKEKKGGNVASFDSWRRFESNKKKQRCLKIQKDTRTSLAFLPFSSPLLLLLLLLFLLSLPREKEEGRGRGGRGGGSR